MTFFTSSPSSSTLAPALRRWRLRVLASALVLAASAPMAQTAEELAAAKLAAEIAEQQKKAAEARKAAAVADAEAANAAAKAASELAKARADADKALADAQLAQANALKAGLPTPPDPSKYRPEAPAAPDLKATVLKLTFEQTDRLAEQLAPKIQAAVVAALGPGAAIEGVLLMPDDDKARALLAQHRGVGASLDLIEAGLRSMTLDLLEAKADEVRAFAGTALAVGSLLENALAYAAALRKVYGFATEDAKTEAEPILLAKLRGHMAASRLRVVDVTAAWPGEGQSSALTAKLDAVRVRIGEAREAVRKATRAPSPGRGAGPDGKTSEQDKKTRQAKAEALAKQADDAEKFLVALHAVNAQGSTLLFDAQRGERLSALLTASTKSFTLAVSVAGSHADTVATDRLFSGLKVHVGNTTVAHWKLVGADGVVLAAGAELDALSPRRVELP
ncbi:MAG: hypothetical protein JNM33_05735 [Rubrivivax sp.]|nr:hypothetical protein [Rubrivivax sp.]